MPLTEESKKRLYLGLLIAGAVLGALFMVFALFFNRGTLTVIAQAPYVIQVPQIKTEACPSSSCSVTLAPGDYTITLKKEGYREVTRQVSVPIGGERKEEIEFEFIPFISLAGEESALLLFARPDVQGDSVPGAENGLPETGVFYDKNYLAYIARDGETRRHTLYVQSIQDGKLGEKTVATSFIRDVKSYKLVLNIEDRGKIALIDDTGGESALYIIDLKEKTRENLFTYPLIGDLKWLPGGSDFLFAARAPGEVMESIYLFKSAEKETIKTDLKTDLKNVVPVAGDRVIAATVQSVGGEEDLSALEGRLVTLGESEATANVLAETTALGGGITLRSEIVAGNILSFIDYSLVSRQARLLRIAPDLAYPQEGRISETQKSVYYLIDGKVYELHFMD